MPLKVSSAFSSANNGVHHHVSRGHLTRYCDEFAFRFEHRKATDGDRAKALVGMAEGKRPHLQATSNRLAKVERERWKREWGPRQLKFKLGLWTL
jgi:hypothetical protein